MIGTKCSLNLTTLHVEDLMYIDKHLARMYYRVKISLGGTTRNHHTPNFSTLQTLRQCRTHLQQVFQSNFF
jgi:hypothetical protein